MLSDGAQSIRCIGMVAGTVTRLVLVSTVGKYALLLDGAVCAAYAILYRPVMTCNKIRNGFFSYQPIFITRKKTYRCLERCAVLRVIADYLMCAICLCVISSLFRTNAPGSHHLISFTAQMRVRDVCGSLMFHVMCLSCGVALVIRVITRLVVFRFLEDILLCACAFAICNRIADRFKHQDVYLGGTYASMMLIFTVPFIGITG